MDYSSKKKKSFFDKRLNKGLLFLNDIYRHYEIVSFHQILNLFNNRFKTEFQVIRKHTINADTRVYVCVSKLDSNAYSCYKFISDDQSTFHNLIEITKRFPKIFHKNILRYYNSWLQTSTKHPNKKNFFIQMEVAKEIPLKKIIEFSKFSTFSQIVEGVLELAKVGLRQKNLGHEKILFSKDLQDELVKLGDVRFLEKITLNEETIQLIVNDILIAARALFAELKNFEEIIDFKGVPMKQIDDLKNILYEMKKKVKYISIENQENLTPFICKKENSFEWLEKLVSIKNHELRLYKKSTDKKADQVFDLETVDIEIEEDSTITIKNPILLGCSIKGRNVLETNQIFQKLISVRGN